ncbi:hypothetical protein NL108_004757, partial [Boleophthalmus pectinirostris]
TKMADIKPKSKRVFVNDVDVFSSKNIAKFLSTCLIEEDEEGEERSTPKGEPAFQVVGTVSSSPKHERHSCVTEYYLSPTREKLLGHLLECDVILYNISENSTQQIIDEATWAVTTLHEEMENFKSRKMFMLISSVMTWAMTKPQNPDEADIPVLEEEFRRRRPHPAFRALYELEKLVLKLGRVKKTRLPAYVVSSGLQYGKGENLFHYFFKVSWLMQSLDVPMFGLGTNYLPMIHINDLGGVIQSIIQNKPKAKYILAVDDSKNTLEEIAISTALGPGKIKQFTEQEAISMKAFQPKQLDYLKINLSLEAALIKELNNQWTSESGMVENIDNIVEEYKVTRNLLPVKIFMVGPPAVGKTTISKKLCGYYRLHHIKIKDVIEEKIKESEPESQDATDPIQEELRKILKNLEEDGSLTADAKLLNIVKEKLSSKPCLNQGFVLDGFPHTYEQAQALFFEEAPFQHVHLKHCNNRLSIHFADNIFVLNASDEFLIERAQALPQSEAEKMHYTQEAFLSRLKGYRKRCAADETLLDYFEELEIYPEEIGMYSFNSSYSVYQHVQANNLQQKINAQRLRQEEERRERLASQAAERKRRNQATLAEMAAHYQEWKKNLLELQRQEQERQSAQSLPLRVYLMKYVMPSLSEAMLECSKVRPEDPVDFL